MRFSNYQPKKMQKFIPLLELNLNYDDKNILLKLIQIVRGRLQLFDDMELTQSENRYFCPCCLVPFAAYSLKSLLNPL